MTKLIEEPTLQPLGHQGEYYFLKITWPVRELTGDPTGLAPRATPIGRHGLVLKMRAEDLPMLPCDGPVLHFDIGYAWKEQERARQSVDVGKPTP